MGAEHELHFQEGFADHVVEVRIDGRLHTTLNLTTRLQSGLAHIETLDLEPGQVVTLHLEGVTEACSFDAASERRWVAINMVDGRLQARPVDVPPGYL